MVFLIWAHRETEKSAVGSRAARIYPHGLKTKVTRRTTLISAKHGRHLSIPQELKMRIYVGVPPPCVSNALSWPQGGIDAQH